MILFLTTSMPVALITFFFYQSNKALETSKHRLSQDLFDLSYILACIFLLISIVNIILAALSIMLGSPLSILMGIMNLMLFFLDYLFVKSTAHKFFLYKYLK